MVLIRNILSENNDETHFTVNNFRLIIKILPKNHFTFIKRLIDTQKCIRETTIQDASVQFIDHF